MRINIAVFAFAAVLAAGSVNAQAYRWVDADGVIHYSDVPHEGAEEIVLLQNKPRPRQPAPAARATPQQQPEEEESQQPFSYESIEVVSPAPEQTLWNIEGTLNVAVSLRPGLREGHSLRVYFDGNPQVVNGTSFVLQEVYRGVHNIQAEVIDETGKLMGRSLPNRFYVQQNSIATVN
jgi:hypothetical protein